MGNSSDLSDLNLSRKGDRAKLASRLVDLAQSLGAKAELKPGCIGQREVCVSIRAARGLGLSVSIRRPANGPVPASFVLPWCLDGTDPHAQLTHEFGEVNPYHRRKATHVAWSVFDLMDQVSNGLSMARDGSAFESSQTPVSEDVSLAISAHAYGAVQLTVGVLRALFCLPAPIFLPALSAFNACLKESSYVLAHSFTGSCRCRRR